MSRLRPMAIDIEHRGANFAQVIVGVDLDPNNPRLKDWTQDYWQALHPCSVGGGYGNDHGGKGSTCKSGLSG